MKNGKFNKIRKGKIILFLFIVLVLCSGCGNSGAEQKTDEKVYYNNEIKKFIRLDKSDEWVFGDINYKIYRITEEGDYKNWNKVFLYDGDRVIYATICSPKLYSRYINSNLLLFSEDIGNPAPNTGFTLM